MSQVIVEALKSLDPSNENHWTADGLPRLETVRMLAGNSSLTRDAVTQAAPGFTRTAAMGAGEAGAGSGEGGATQDGNAQPGADTGPAQGAGDGEGGDDGAADPEGGPGEGGSEGGEAQADPLVEAQAALDAARADKRTVDARVAAAQAQVDAILEKRAKENGPRNAFPVVMRGYLDSQAEVRAARGKRLQELRGTPLADLIPKPAPIDAAFKRNTARGTKRPSRL